MKISNSKMLLLAGLLVTAIASPGFSCVPSPTGQPPCPSLPEVSRARAEHAANVAVARAQNSYERVRTTPVEFHMLLLVAGYATETVPAPDSIKTSEALLDALEAKLDFWWKREYALEYKGQKINRPTGYTTFFTDIYDVVSMPEKAIIRAIIEDIKADIEHVHSLGDDLRSSMINATVFLARKERFYKTLPEVKRMAGAEAKRLKEQGERFQVKLPKLPEIKPDEIKFDTL